MEEKLNKLMTILNEMEPKMQNCDLSDSYLRENNCSTREDIGIGEYVYGISMVPCEWVYPFLNELFEIWSKEESK